MPLAAPVPARPTKWPLPMLLANRDAPTFKKKKKKSFVFKGRNHKMLIDNLLNFEDKNFKILDQMTKNIKHILV